MSDPDHDQDPVHDHDTDHALGHSHGPDPDRGYDDPPDWADLPDGEASSPVTPKKRPAKPKPKPKAEIEAEPKPKVETKPKAERAEKSGCSIPEQMEKFRKRCVESGIKDDQDLYATLSTNFRASLEVKQAVADLKENIGTGARGLTPEGEHELARRICIQVEAATRETMAKHRLHVGRMLGVSIGVACLLSALVGAGAAFGFGWASGSASVRTAERELMGVFARGPDSVKAAAQLLANNDAAVMLGDCKGQDVQVYGGRRACHGAFWLEPAPQPNGVK